MLLVSLDFNYLNCFILQLDWIPKEINKVVDVCTLSRMAIASNKLYVICSNHWLSTAINMHCLPLKRVKQQAGITNNLKRLKLWLILPYLSSILYRFLFLLSFRHLLMFINKLIYLRKLVKPRSIWLPVAMSHTVTITITVK